MSTVYTLTTLAETVGHWRFNNDLIDRSSSGYYLAGVGLSASKYTTGYTESGITSIDTTAGTVGATRVAAGVTNLDMGTSDFTIEAIVKTSQTDLAITGIVHKWANGGTHGYRLGLCDTGVVRTQVGDAATSVTLDTNEVVNDNVWHYIVMVVDRAGLNQLSLYVDGAVDTSSSISTITGNVSPNTENFEIAYTTAAGQFKGSVDEICITKRALTATEILARSVGHGDPTTFMYSGSAAASTNNIGTVLNTFDIKLKHDCNHNLTAGQLTLNTCTRCLGTGYYYDIKFDNTGRPPILNIEDKLAQSLEKMVLTSENKFHVNLVTGLNQHIGALVDDVEAIIRYDLIQAVATLKENQRGVINLSPRAQIASLDDVIVIKENESSLRYIVEITTVSGEQVELTGAIALLG